MHQETSVFFTIIIIKNARCIRLLHTLWQLFSTLLASLSETNKILFFPLSNVNPFRNIRFLGQVNISLFQDNRKSSIDNVLFSSVSIFF